MDEIPRLRRRSRLAAVARRFGVSEAGLHRCVVCGSDCVCPVDWETDGPEHWLIRLRCGECDVWRDARASNAEAKALDLVLDRQVAQIARAVAAIDGERMRVAAEVFVLALERDLIGPADFAGR
jgi:hypothetical protein